MANKMKRSELHSYNCDRCEWTGNISGLIHLDTAHCPGCGYDGTLERQSNTNQITRAADMLREAKVLIKDGDQVCGSCSGSGIYDNDGSPPCGSCNGSGYRKLDLDDVDLYIHRTLAILEGRE